jgi:hypothetical protein
VKFLIRDDDTCAFTAPEELEKCYDHIWNAIPINLSITPFRVPGRYRSVPREFYGREDPIPLAQNQELVAFLKENKRGKRVHIAMHGYHHTMSCGLPEYMGGKDLFAKTKKGKAYLEEVLGCLITTFVPPNNGIAREGFEAIVGNGLNMVNIPPFSPRGCRSFRFANIMNFSKVAYFRLIKKMQYPYVLCFPDHKEVSFYSITPDQHLDFLINGFKKCARVDGVFILAVHYHAFERRIKTGQKIADVVNLLVKMASRENHVQYLTWEELWRS